MAVVVVARVCGWQLRIGMVMVIVRDCGWCRRLMKRKVRVCGEDP